MSSEVVCTNRVGKHEIEEFQKWVESHPDQVDLPVEHFHVSAAGDSGGLYARQMLIPKGMVVVGNIHKYEHLNIISQGDITVVTEEGAIRIKAPYTLVSPPGTKRSVYTHEDTVWTAIHGTNEKDVAVIEQKFIAKSYEQYLEFVEEQKLLLEEK